MSECDIPKKSVPTITIQVRGEPGVGKTKVIYAITRLFAGKYGFSCDVDFEAALRLAGQPVSFPTIHIPDEGALDGHLQDLSNRGTRILIQELATKPALPGPWKAVVVKEPLTEEERARHPLELWGAATISGETEESYLDWVRGRITNAKQMGAG